MDRKQKFAVGLSPVLFLVMLGVYQGFARIIGSDLGWYAGFLIYWPIFCLIIPMLLLGRKRIISLFFYKKTKFANLAVAFLPALITAIGAIFIFKNSRELSFVGQIIWIAMSFGNGIFEEILWRGVYIDLFPEKKAWGFVWPTIWFSLWHLAPGSLSHNFSPYVLVPGALFFGACWGWGAYKTKSTLWSSSSHTLTGLIQLFY